MLMTLTLLCSALLPSAAYMASLLGTLYASLIMQSYIFSLASCGAQVVTLVYYVASFFPGGASSAQFVFGTVGRGRCPWGVPC